MFIFLLMLFVSSCTFIEEKYTGKAIVEPTEGPSLRDAEALILLEPNSSKGNEVADLIRQNNGKVKYITKEAIIATNVPLTKLFKNGDVKNIFFNGNMYPLEEPYKKETRLLAQNWVYQEEKPDKDTNGEGPIPHIESDLRVKSEIQGGLFKSTASSFCDRPGTGTAVNTGFCDTTEFMAGDVSVAIILMESNGMIDNETEDWNSTEEAEVTSEILNALSWWVERAEENNIPLTFHPTFYYKVPTGYEPINHNSVNGDTCDYMGDEYLWKNDALGYLGVTEDCWEGEITFLNNLREQDNTDWAFAIFVVDSSNDPDGRFLDNKFAYSWLGGPSFTMTYDNYAVTIENMEVVAAHETGHIFWAFDQYAQSHGCHVAGDCEKTTGYLNVENQNCVMGGCTSNEPSIMRGGTSPYFSKQIDTYAKGQIGWLDNSEQGKPYILLTQPTTYINEYSPNPTSQTELGLTGFAQETQGHPNSNPYHMTWPSVYGPLNDISINSISVVEYRLNNGPWIEISCSDGSCDSREESYQFTTVPAIISLSGAKNLFEIKSKNNVGFESEIVSEEITVKKQGKRTLISELSLPNIPSFRLPWQ